MSAPVVAMALITIRRGDEWQTKPVEMQRADADKLAAECVKRGLTVVVIPV